MTAQRLQEIALRFFADKGYDGTSLADIAGAIGIKKPSIYAHYSSKLDLFLAVADTALHDYRQSWRRALDKGEALPADRRLQSLFEEMGEHFLADRTKLAFWIRLWVFPPADCPAGVRDAFQTLTGEYLAEVAAVFRAGMEQGRLRPGPADDLAHALFSLLVGFLIRAHAYQDTDHLRLLRQTWDCFMFGIKTEDG
ncbi:MAG TPA: TetR/AcrR family transcriptional regulator [Selenomonadales bacterium]|nr:TetR/AcrR family transcriptional regulator [Selenomonadales bacterium]